MVDIIAAVPAFWFLAAGTLAAILAELALLLVARARLRQQAQAQSLASAGEWRAIAALTLPSRLAEITAALIPFALAAVFARTIRTARSLLVSPPTDKVAPDEHARLVSRALSNELNATPMGLLAVSITVGIACAAVGMAVVARLRAAGLRRAGALAPEAPDTAAAWLKFPGPTLGPIAGSIAAFLVLGCGPIVQAGYAAIILKIKAFATVAVAASGDVKGAIMSGAMDESSALLDRALVFGRIGVGVAVLIAAFLAWHFSPARARARLPGGMDHGAPRKGAAGITLACCAIAAAAAAFVATRPLRLENRTPWPPYAGGERFLGLIATADLDGPDPMERAPVIHLTPDAMGLDGVAWDAPSLASQLGSLANMYRRLRPNEIFNGQALLICQADTPADRLAAALRAAVDGEAPHVTFGFLRRQVTDRPLFGHRWRNVPSAARTTVVKVKADAEADAALIAVDRFPTCAAISKEIVAARRAGRDVALLLPTDR